MTIQRVIQRVATLALCIASLAASAGQATYPSTDEAVRAFWEAAKAPSPEALSAVLGDDYASLGSGDPVADRESLADLLTAAEGGARVEQESASKATLLIGADEWPLPIPLVNDGNGWRFDTAAGREEVRNRQIGRDELHAMASLRAVVDAQQEYRADGYGGGAYATKVRSSEGQRDGLYWPAEEGAPESPLGVLVADAELAGYAKPGSGERKPFYGYFFKLLTSQGPNAPGGAQDYLKDGRLVGGFAVVAYPAEYGRSGIQTFMISDRGILFQKDLGEQTAATAEAMTSFDPDEGWEPVEDPVL